MTFYYKGIKSLYIYINFLKGQRCMQQHLFEHFASESHCSFLEDVTITFIDKTDPKDPNRREHH